MDPDPKKTVSKYPRIVRWCEQGADQWNRNGDNTGELTSFPESTPFAQMILSEIPTTYKPYILANAHAQANGDKAFVVTTYEEEVSYLSRPYPELSRQMIINRIANETNAEERQTVEEWLAAVSLTECF